MPDAACDTFGDMRTTSRWFPVRVWAPLSAVALTIGILEWNARRQAQDVPSHNQDDRDVAHGDPAQDKVASTRALVADLAGWGSLPLSYKSLHTRFPQHDGPWSVGWVWEPAVKGNDALEVLDPVAGRPPLVDAWGQPLLFRCPGRQHPHGWDLYSVGPNGRDELGSGDDILVGEDVAPTQSTTHQDH
jgi:hypothetical protein